MPASMISAPTGGRQKVSGSSIAIVASGPMPGSTPISVPTSAPIRHSPRLIGVTATEKPWPRLPTSSKRISIFVSSEPRPQLKRQIKPVREQQRAERGEHRAPDQRLDPVHLLGGIGRDHQRDVARDDETERAHRDGEDDGGCGDEQRPARRHMSEQEGEYDADNRADRGDYDVLRDA